MLVAHGDLLSGGVKGKKTKHATRVYNGRDVVGSVQPARSGVIVSSYAVKTDGALSFSMGQTLMKPARILCTLWVLCTSNLLVDYPVVAGSMKCTHAIDSVVLFVSLPVLLRINGCFTQVQQPLVATPITPVITR